MNKEDHYKKQLKYFENEFGKINSYTLAPWQANYIARIKKDLVGKNYKGRTLLDVATGSGYIAIEMAKLGLKVLAIDLSPEAIKNLNKFKKELKLNNLEIKKSLAEKMDLKSNSFDYLVANAILEHIPDEQQAINEWKRVVKPNGKMFITTPIRFRYIYPILWLPNIIHDLKIGHIRRYHKKDFINRFKLPIIKVYYTGHFIKVIGILLSKLTKNSKLDDAFEKKDRKKEKNIYGANNISVILKNVKGA